MPDTKEETTTQRKLLVPLAVLTALSMVVGACGVTAPVSPTTAAGAGAGGTVKIGLQGAMTGDYASEGTGFDKALKMLVEQTNAAGGINGQKVELSVEDDKGDPKEAVLVAERLKSKGVVAVIGSYNSSATETASAIYSEAGILHITPSATATRLTEKGYKRFFRTAFLDDRQGLFAAKLAKEVLNLKTVGILHDNSSYMKDLAEWTKKYLEDQGIKVAFFDAINPQDMDFTPVLTKIKNANLEAVYFAGYHAQGGLLLKQSDDVGLKLQWMMDSACNNPELAQIAGLDNAKGVYVTSEPLPIDLPYPEAKKFNDDFKAKYGDYPKSVWTVLAADAYKVIAYAIQQTKSTDPGKLADYLHSDLKNYPGISGPIVGFDAKGDRLGTMHRAYVINEKGELVLNPKQPAS